MRFGNPLLSLSLACAAAAFGCQKEQAPSAEPAGSIEKPTTIDPELAKAVAAASAGVGKRGAAPAGSGGPPAGGVFGPGEADKQIKVGAAPIVTLGSNGSEPRVTLGPLQPKPGWKASGTVQLAVQSDARGALPFELGVTLEAQKPKGGDGDAGGPVPVTIVAKVVSAKVGVAGVPADFAARVDKLKGSRVEYQVAPDGSGNGFKQELAPGAEEVRDQLRGLSDALALVTLPVPNQPLGQGAFWLATSREGVFGLDLVTYRMIKVEQASDAGVTLSVSTKRYATSDRFDFQGLPPDAPRELSEFESKSDGKLEFKIGAPFPQSGEVQSLLAAGLAMGGQQRGMLQIQSRVGLDFRGAAK